MTKVWITHPDTGGVSLVAAESVTEVWALRGWRPVAIDYAAASAAAGVPITRPAQLGETYVRERAAEQAAAAAASSEPDPAPEPAETTTSTRRAGRKTTEETV